jgi:hypothetical protein
MIYKNKVDFIKNHNFRKYGLVEYIIENEKHGLDEKQIQAKMIVDNVTKSPRAVQDNFSFYKSVKKNIGWK